MASLRNLAIGILRRQGHRNIAAALRRNARDATRVLPLLGITRAVPVRVAAASGEVVRPVIGGPTTSMPRAHDVDGFGTYTSVEAARVRGTATPASVGSRTPSWTVWTLPRLGRHGPGRGGRRWRGAGGSGGEPRAHHGGHRARRARAWPRRPDLARPLGHLLPGHPQLVGAAARRPLRRRGSRRLHAEGRDRRLPGGVRGRVRGAGPRGGGGRLAEVGAGQRVRPADLRGRSRRPVGGHHHRGLPAPAPARWCRQPASQHAADRR